MTRLYIQGSVTLTILQAYAASNTADDEEKIILSISGIVQNGAVDLIEAPIPFLLSTVTVKLTIRLHRWR